MVLAKPSPPNSALAFKGAQLSVGFKENRMNVFEEFKRLVMELEKHKVRYALVGGVAMAFYTEPRFTRDIDLLVDSEDFEKTKGILENDEYFESTSPWTFRNVAIELHRFLKVTPEDEMMIDILVAKDEEVRRIIQDTVVAESEEGRVMLANKNDLFWLKRSRDSKQDQADFEKLEDDKDR
ncbi:MAG: hypothetical protein QG552_178 [Thermodesulfobacteriota bacterium]|nr:hypothetical protein [Thermodesulfobacteriota bacterium]